MNYIIISESEANSMVSFIDDVFVPYLSKAEGIDSMEYVSNICSVYKKIKDSVLEEEE